MTQFEMVPTIAEANAQVLDVPEYGGWFAFAHTLDGYSMVHQLGFSREAFAKLRSERIQTYDARGGWEASLLELRVILFLEARARRFNDAPGYEPDKNPKYRKRMLDSLDAIRTKAKAEGRLADKTE